MTKWRLEAFSSFKKWLNLIGQTKYKKPDLQKFHTILLLKKPKHNSLEEVDPELLKTFDKLGISIDEQKKLSGVAVDIVMDSVSVATTFRETLAKRG